MVQLPEKRDLGLLILRTGIGLCFFYVYGLPKLTAGPEMWERIGGAMVHFGITFWPVLWGLCASLAEGVGGLFLALGVGMRTAAAFMAFTMLVAATHHLASGDPLHKASPAICAGVVFLALVWLGSGKYAIRPNR